MNAGLIYHPKFKAAQTSLIDFIHNSSSPNGQSRCAVISGFSRCGKSTLAETIQNYINNLPLPKRKSSIINERKRVVYVETPSAATQKSMAQTIQIELGDPVVGRSMSQAQLLNRVSQLLYDLDVELLVLDDFHHLITTGKRIHAAEVAESVKTLLNTGVCPILLIGVDPVYKIMTENSQLKGRCWCHVSLEPFGWSTKTEKAIFSKLLRQLASQLTISPAFDPGDPDFACRMHLVSEGAIGIISLLNEKAVAIAVRLGLNALTLDTFADAYDDWVSAEYKHEKIVRNAFRIN